MLCTLIVRAGHTVPLCECASTYTVKISSLTEILRMHLCYTLYVLCIRHAFVNGLQMWCFSSKCLANWYENVQRHSRTLLCPSVLLRNRQNETVHFLIYFNLLHIYTNMICKKPEQTIRIDEHICMEYGWGTDLLFFFFSDPKSNGMYSITMKIVFIFQFDCTLFFFFIATLRFLFHSVRFYRFFFTSVSLRLFWNGPPTANNNLLVRLVVTYK